MLCTFEGNINLGYPTGIKLYLQATKEIDKETDKLDISVKNDKCILYQFIILANKYGWGSLIFMVGTDTCANNIFRLVEQIQLAEMKN